MLYYLLYPIGYLLFKFFFRFQIYGRKNLPLSGPYIIASNHLSFIDPILIGLLKFGKLNFIAKEELFHNKIFGTLIRILGAFPLGREGREVRAVREALCRLKAGKILVVFPEGTRSPDGKLGRPLRGVGLLAKRAKVKVVPVYLEGSDLALPLKAYFIRFKKIRVFVGRPIDPDFFEPDILTQKIWEEMERLENKAKEWR